MATDTATTRVSETIVNGKRRLNAVIATGSDIIYTKNFAELGGHRLRSYALNKNYATLPIMLDAAPTPADASAIIDGKIFDVDLSGSNGAYCLSLNNTNRSIVPVRNVQIGNILLPVNEFGDVILAGIPIPSPLEIVEEDAVSWMNRQLRVVNIALMGWHLIVNY